MFVSAFHITCHYNNINERICLSVTILYYILIKWPVYIQKNMTYSSYIVNLKKIRVIEKLYNVCLHKSTKSLNRKYRDSGVISTFSLKYILKWVRFKIVNIFSFHEILSAYWNIIIVLSFSYVETYTQKFINIILI